MDNSTVAPPGGQSVSDRGIAGRVVLPCGGLNLLRCFARAGIPVLVADADPDSLTLCSRYARARRMIADPLTHPKQAVEDLLAIGSGFREPPMLAYDNDTMLLLVSRNREALAKYYRLLLPPAELVEDLVGKLRFASLAERLKWPAPKTLLHGEERTAEDIAEIVGLPCILKPDSHVGRFHEQVIRHEHDRPYKVLRADTLEDLRLKLERMRCYCDSFLVQQYISGGDDCLYSFHGCFDRDARLMGAFVGRKVRTYPRDSGFSTFLELVHEPDVLCLGLEILQKINYVGPMKLDFKKDAIRGRYYLLECNPRFTLWNYLGTACGMNLPQMFFAHLHGQPVQPVTQYRTHTRWLSLGNDLRALVREYHPDRTWTWPRWLWSLLGRKVYDVFSWKDPWPWIVCAARYLRANWRKLTRRFARRTPAQPPPDASLPNALANKGA